MKMIIFIRHGRAEDPAPDISDLERSLTIKGKVISRQMARDLREIEKSRGLIISSPAFRALETAIIFAEEFGVDPEKIILNSKLYYKMNFKYLSEILSAVSEDFESVFLFGHNPSFTEIADRLCKGGCEFIPKCGIAGISFNIGRWTDTKLSSGNLEYFLKPEKAI
jgi:phosphohistidine phosphatase